MLALLLPRFPMLRLTIYCHSLGASTAFSLLEPRKGVPNAAAAVYGLVLETAFTIVPDMLACSTH
jgi:hypothetical protein